MQLSMKVLRLCTNIFPSGHIPPGHDIPPAQYYFGISNQQLVHNITYPAPLQPVNFRWEHFQRIRFVFSAFLVYAKPSLINLTPPWVLVINSVIRLYWDTYWLCFVRVLKLYCGICVLWLVVFRPITFRHETRQIQVFRLTEQKSVLCSGRFADQRYELIINTQITQTCLWYCSHFSLLGIQYSSLRKWTKGCMIIGCMMIHRTCLDWTGSLCFGWESASVYINSIWSFLTYLLCWQISNLYGACLEYFNK